MSIDRCVCRDTTFEDLKRLAKEQGLDIDALMEETGCGNVCGLCVPYLKIMLRTGKTRIPLQIDAQEFARIMAGPGDDPPDGPQ